MSRLRLNDLIGTIVTNPATLDGSSNTVTWAVAPSFPVISAPDYAVLILEPDNANEEICWLVGYTPGQLTGLVQRAAEASTGGCALGSPVAHTSVAWCHGPTAFDFKSPSGRMAARMMFR